MLQFANLFTILMQLIIKLVLHSSDCERLALDRFIYTVNIRQARLRYVKTYLHNFILNK